MIIAYLTKNYINLQQYSADKPDFHESVVFKKYDREGV